MGADLLELADVLVHFRRGRHHRPHLPDLGASHIEEAGPDRCREPLVEARAVVIAVEVALREREMGVRMRAIHDYFDPPRTAQLRDLLHREDLAREIRDVADMNDFGARRDRFLDASRQVVLGRRRHRERDLLQYDAVAPLALLPGRDHARIILRRRQHLVAALERQAQLHDLERLARVAGDRHLFGVATEARGQPAADRFDGGLDPGPHRDRRRLIRDREVALKRRIDHARARGHAAIVEVDHAAIDVEGLLDLAPEVLVLRYRGGVAAVDGSHHGENARQGVALERGEGGGRRKQRSEKTAASRHQGPRVSRRNSTAYASRLIASTNVPSTICTRGVSPDG